MSSIDRIEKMAQAAANDAVRSRAAATDASQCARVAEAVAAAWKEALELVRREQKGDVQP